MQRRLSPVDSPLRVWLQRFAAVSFLVISLMTASLDFYRPDIGANIRIRFADAMVPLMDGLRRPIDGARWLGGLIQTNQQLRARITVLEAERDALKPELNRLGTLEAVLNNLAGYLGFDLANAGVNLCETDGTSSEAAISQNLCVESVSRQLSLLRAYMGFSDDNSVGLSRAGRVVQVSAGSFGRTALLRIDDTREIRASQAAISLEGMVGAVTEVGRNSVRIRLITDPASSVAARVLRTRADVIVRGSGGSTLTIANADADEINAMAPGDLLLTSGAGGFFEENIPLGEVTSVEAGVVEVQPIVDLNRLLFVNIILSAPPDLPLDRPSDN